MGTSDFANEYQPLLENSEARARAARTRHKKRTLLAVSLALVGVALVVAITVPLVIGGKEQPINDDAGSLDDGAAMEEVALFASNWSPDTCSNPPVPITYDRSGLEGTWYEIAKIQTPNAAVQQEGCSCTSMTLQLNASEGQQQLMSTKCNDARLAGSVCGAIPVMEETTKRGAWTQTLYGAETSWHVFLQHDSVLLTYDCVRSYDNEIQYGIHLYSRQRYMDPVVFSTKFDGLLQLYGAFLNPQKIAPVVLDQSNCDSDDSAVNSESVVENAGASDILDLNMDSVLSD